MRKITEVIRTLLDLARLFKKEPANKAKIGQAQMAVYKQLEGSVPKDLMRLLDEIIKTGFYSSEVMEPDGKGGSVWAHERSWAYCDCLFRLTEIVKKSGFSTKKKEWLCGTMIVNGMNLSTLVSFCREFGISQPLPDLLSFEGRNGIAQMLGPKMPELTRKILGLVNQAKELERQGKHKEATETKEKAERLNTLYGKMEKHVLPWLERKERSTITLGMACEEEENSVTRIVKDVLDETSRK